MRRQQDSVIGCCSISPKITGAVSEDGGLKLSLKAKDLLQHKKNLMIEKFGIRKCTGATEDLSMVK